MILGAEVLARDDGRNLLRVGRPMVRHFAVLAVAEDDVGDNREHGCGEDRGDASDEAVHERAKDAARGGLNIQSKREHRQRREHQRPQVHPRDVPCDSQIGTDAGAFGLERGGALGLKRPRERRVVEQPFAHSVQRRQGRGEWRRVLFDEHLETLAQLLFGANALD